MGKAPSVNRMKTTILAVAVLAVALSAAMPTAEAHHEDCGQKPVEVCSHFNGSYTCYSVWIRGEHYEEFDNCIN